MGIDSIWISVDHINISARHFDLLIDVLRKVRKWKEILTKVIVKRKKLTYNWSDISAMTTINRGDNLTNST